MSENKINSGKVFPQKHAAEAQTASETEKEQFERLRSQSTSSESDSKQKHRWVPRKWFLVFAGISMALLTIAITLTAIFMLSQNGKDSTSGIDSEDAEVQVEPCSDMFCAGEHHLKIQDDTCECVLSENGHDQKIKENINPSVLPEVPSLISTTGTTAFRGHLNDDWNLYNDEYNGRPQWVRHGGSHDLIRWDGVQWELRDTTISVPHYVNNQDTMLPTKDGWLAAGVRENPPMLHYDEILLSNTFSLGSSLDDDEIEPDYTDCLLMMCHSEASATMVDGICECVIQEQFRCDYAWDWSTEKQIYYSTDLDCFGPGETECGRFINYPTNVRTPKWVTCEEWDMFDSDTCGWFAFYEDFEEYEKCQDSWTVCP